MDTKLRNTHTHTHAFPLPSCLSPRVVYREYKLDFGENSWRAAVLRRGWKISIRKVSALREIWPRDNTTAAVSYPFRLKKLLRCLYSVPRSSPTPPSSHPFLSRRVFMPRQRRDQSFRFPGTKFCSTLVNADDRKGFERDRFLPVASEDLSVFYFLRFSSFTVLPPSFFSSPRRPTPSSSTRCLQGARVYSCTGRVYTA